MNNKPENNQDKLLDAALGDEAWTGLSAGVKDAAMREFGVANRRKRTRGAWLQAAACFLLAVGIAALMWRNPALPVHSGTPARLAPKVNNGATFANAELRSPTSAQQNTAKDGYITEEQMLAMFPKGSCVIAEIEGRRQLVFFDKKIETEGVAYGG